MLRRWIFGALAAAVFMACNVPMQVKTYYPNGYLKDRYWAYEQDGREIRSGLYTAWYPNGEKQLEIYYEDGEEISKSFYSETGYLIGTVELAEARLR